MSNLENELKQFTGTEQYWQHWSKRLIYTDGVKYLCDEAACYWLIDLISSYLKEVITNPNLSLGARSQDGGTPSGSHRYIHFWRLDVDLKKQSAILTCARR